MHCARWIVTGAFLSVILVGQSGAQCLQPDDYMHGAAFHRLGGEPQNLHAFASTLLAHHDDQLVLIDASDPENLVTLGAATVPTSTSDIASDGNHGYVTANGGTPGLYVVDLQDPGSMSVIGYLGGMEFAKALTISNGIVFVAGRLNSANNHCVIAVDVNDPTQPMLLDNVAVQDNYYDRTWIRAEGDLLLVCGAYGLDLIDATNPSDLVYAAKVPLTFHPEDAAISGNTLFAVGCYFETVDISDPYAPVVDSSTPWPAPCGETIQLHGSLATIRAFGNLRVCDLSSPGVYTELGTLSLPYTLTRDVVYVGDYAMAAAPDGIYVAKVVPTMPLPTLEFNPHGDGAVQDVLIEDDLAYVTTYIYASLMIFDMTDPLVPMPLGSVSTGQEGFALDKEGDLVAAAFLNWAGPAGIRLIDVSDPGNPTIVSTYDPPGGAVYDVSLAASRAYVPNSEGVHILDVANPAAPVELGLLPVSGTPKAVGYTLYLATDAYGLEIYDVTDPAAVIAIGAEPIATQARSITVDGNHVYLGGADGIRIVDVSDPTSPLVLGSAKTKDFPREMAHRDGYLYVATGAAGVEAFDVSNRWVPRPIMDLGIGQEGSYYASYLGLGPHYLWASNNRLHYTELPCERVVAVQENRAPARLSGLTLMPNPFNPQTTIEFDLSASSPVTLVIYDVAGRRVRTLADGESMTAGPQRRIWDGRDDAGQRVSSGVYFASVRAKETELLQKMTLVK